jgi:hypothetical protein
LLQTLDLNNVNDDEVKNLKNMIHNTYLVKGRETGYELIDAKLIHNSKLNEKFK